MIVWNDFRNDARVLKEAETLQMQGYQVAVFALHQPSVTVKNENFGSGIKVIRTVRSPFAYLTKQTPTKSSANEPSNHFSRLRLVRLVLARIWTHFCIAVKVVYFRPRVVHAHDVNTLPTGWIAASFSGAKLVYDAHEISTSREGYTSVRALVGRVEKYLMPKADGSITTTDARAKFFARAYGIPRPIVLQNRPRYEQTLKTARIRTELGLTNPWPIVLYQGGIQQGRGLERLARIAAKVEGAYFVYIGSGRIEADIKNTVRELDLGEKVFFIPTVPLADLPEYTASADIGVQPIENTCLNHFTTDSNKLFEYVIAGLPVVASDLPEIRKVVGENDLGLLVPPGDSLALVSALQTLVDDAPLRERYRQASVVAAKELNWEQQEHKLTELYARIRR